jgi:hypothetical protein
MEQVPLLCGSRTPAQGTRDLDGFQLFRIARATKEQSAPAHVSASHETAWKPPI